ncbi:hypothetical protein AVEN_165316-1 [Araneus ventricosus]|uniref:Uncharacterized protein n=1 Tax=Araneus ventricosus TaxID=182803 RepID=A0A4Y2ASW9_ARAVE|nr:hypothetical protein AVEN_165316-1 [Araneus ventricosus]
MAAGSGIYGGNVSVSGSESSRFEIGFQQGSAIHLDLVCFKSDNEGQTSSRWCAVKFSERVPDQVSSSSSKFQNYKVRPKLAHTLLQNGSLI